MKMLQTLKEKMKFNKRGQAFANLNAAIIGLVSFAVIAVVGFLILAQFRANATVQSDPTTLQAVNQTQIAMAQIPQFLGIIVIVVVGAILIGLVAAFVIGSGQGRR